MGDDMCRPRLFCEAVIVGVQHITVQSKTQFHYKTSRVQVSASRLGRLMYCVHCFSSLRAICRNAAWLERSDIGPGLRAFGRHHKPPCFEPCGLGHEHDVTIAGSCLDDDLAQTVKCATL